MVEIELKFNLKSIEDIIVKLERLGSKIVQERSYEKTSMFDNADQLMQLSDGRVRLRTSAKKNELSYKKPISRNGIKREIEYETVISDANMMEKILNKMGFKIVSCYERYRTEYSTNNVKVTIDEYPFDNFIELEGDEPLILKLAKELHLNLSNNITKSCDTLFTEWRISKGLPPTENMTFDGYNR